jgi:hypothetical protein
VSFRQAIASCKVDFGNTIGCLFKKQVTFWRLLRHQKLKKTKKMRQYCDVLRSIDIAFFDTIAWSSGTEEF